MNERLLPCQVNPDLTCPFNCPNRAKLLILLEPLLEALRTRNIPVGDEQKQYNNLVETIKELIAHTGGPGPEVRNDCKNLQPGNKPMVQ